MNYNDGKWHGWNGGECPVHPETIVEVAMFDKTDPFRNVDSWKGVDKPRAGDITGGWKHKDGHRHVVAFRVVKEHKEPREFWLHDGMSFPTFEDAIKYKYDVPVGNDPVIHVREVIE